MLKLTPQRIIFCLLIVFLRVGKPLCVTSNPVLLPLIIGQFQYQKTVKEILKQRVTHICSQRKWANFSFVFYLLMHLLLLNIKYLFMQTSITIKV